jgi:hypothetical protein
MSKLKYILLVLLIVGTFYFPIFVKHKFSEELEVHRENFHQNGVKIEVLEEKGYLNSERDLNITITDGREFAKYLFSNIGNPSGEDLNNVAQLLEGMEFFGVLKNSNTLPTDIELDLFLKEFSYLATESYSQNSETEKEIRAILDKNKIAFFVLFDSFGEFKSLKMEDFDEKLTGGNLQVLGLSLLKRDGVDIFLKKARLGVTFEEFVSIEDVNYSYNGLTYGKISLKNFEIKSDYDGIAIGNAVLEGEIFKDTTSTYFLLENVETAQNIKVSKLESNLLISGLHPESIKKLEDINSLSEAELEKLYLNLINNGFLLDINISIADISSPLVPLSGGEIVSKSEIEKNVGSQPEEFIQYFKNSTTLKIAKEDGLVLFTLQPQLAALAKEVGDELIFEIEINGAKPEFLINGFPLPLF